MIALDIAVGGLVAGNLAWPAVLLRALSARQAAQDAVPGLPPAPDQHPVPAAASGPQDAPRVFDPAARPRPRDQFGRLVSKERLAELAAEGNGKDGQA